MRDAALTRSAHGTRIQTQGENATRPATLSVVITTIYPARGASARALLVQRARFAYARFVIRARPDPRVIRAHLPSHPPRVQSTFVALNNTAFLQQLPEHE